MQPFVFMSVTKLEGIHGREIEERRRSRLHVAGFLLALLLVVAAVASAALTIAQIVRR